MDDDILKSPEVSVGSVSSIGLTTVHNVRDVGATINRFFGKNVMKEGVFFRSGRLDNATAADMELLTDATHLKSIIDLRSKTELERMRTRDPVAVVSGATVYHISFMSDLYTKKALLGKLPWYRLVQVLFCHLLGFRETVMRIVSSLVVVPMGLKNMANECLKWLGPEIKQTLTILSSEDKLPALVHCTQGKDRTGLVSLLVLLAVLGDMDEHTVVKAVDYDYMLSNEGLKGMRQEMLNEMLPLGFTESFADAEEGWVDSVVTFIEGRGGIQEYLASVGVKGDDIKRLRERLLVNP
ncbi:hypothetical protein ABW20_dc0104624 [Dactylellina cionopaga]|nr:hypothetical protein ABW20_dc0104624 [Dactylellina cionopaga]